MQILFLFFWFVAIAELPAQKKVNDEVYLFSYFKGNGEDGLHLASSNDGYTWIALKNDSAFLWPTAGHDKLMRDPCIIKGPDGTFHMVWTVSWNEKGIGYASSKDLVHWSKQRYLPVMEHEEGARNCWAPEIFYDASTHQFMIYWASTITGQFTETLSTRENSYNHRIYYVTTSDFDSFSKAAILYNQGFNVIDATLIKQGKTYTMFLKDETIEPPQKNIRIATSTKLSSEYGKPGEPITGRYWAEGPTCLKLDDHWIVYFDKYMDHRMGAVSSPDLIHWVDISEKVSFPEGVRHGSAFRVSKEVYLNLVK